MPRQHATPFLDVALPPCMAVTELSNVSDIASVLSIATGGCIGLLCRTATPRRHRVWQGRITEPLLLTNDGRRQVKSVQASLEVIHPLHKDCRVGSRDRASKRDPRYILCDCKQADPGLVIGVRHQKFIEKPQKFLRQKSLPVVRDEPNKAIRDRLRPPTDFSVFH